MFMMFCRALLELTAITVFVMSLLFWAAIIAAIKLIETLNESLASAEEKEVHDFLEW